MSRPRSIYHAVNLLSKSRNRDPIKWSEIYRGLHRRVKLLSSLNVSNDQSINSITSNDLFLLFEAFSRISKCKELIELNITQKINSCDESSKLDSTNIKYNEYTFGFYDLVNLYLPLTLKYVDDMDINETFKLLSLLKILGQEYYLIHNTSLQLSEKFRNQCSLLSPSQICQLIRIFSRNQTKLVIDIIVPLINELHVNIMNLTINQVYEILETLYLINEIPCSQILYDCYVRTREECNRLSIRQIAYMIACYSKHLKYTNTYIKQLISHFSDFLVNKFNVKQQSLNSIDISVICKLFKSYSNIGYISTELFDVLFNIIPLISNKITLIHYSIISQSLSLLQKKHNLYVFIDYSKGEFNLLPETYNIENIDYNPIRYWLKVKYKLNAKDKNDEYFFDINQYDKKNEMKALILMPKENYHSNFSNWWKILLTNLSTHLE